MAVTTVPLAYLNYRAAKAELDLRFSLLGPMLLDAFVAFPLTITLLGQIF